MGVKLLIALVARFLRLFLNLSVVTLTDYKEEQELSDLYWLFFCYSFNLDYFNITLAVLLIASDNTKLL